MSIAPKAHEVLDWILRDDQGDPRWLFQLGGKLGAAFLPTGLLDFANLTADPVTPPANRIRIYFKDGLLYQIEGPSGSPVGSGAGSMALWQCVDVNDSVLPASGRILVGCDAQGATPARWCYLPVADPGNVLQLNPGETIGVAWVPMGRGASPTALPGFYSLGDPLSYFTQGSVLTASEVQYTRIWLLKDQELSQMRCYQVQGGSIARYFRMGLYRQAVGSEEDPTADPTDKLAETASTDTPAGLNGSFRDVAFTTGNLTIPYSGWFWIAFITDTTTPLQWSTTGGPYPPAFLPVRRELSTGTTLPATASGLANPTSAVVFAAAKEA